MSSPDTLSLPSVEDMAAQMRLPEIALLLFLETCCVDRCGVIDSAHMNADDHARARNWAQTGLIRFCRIPAAYLTPFGSHVVEFTDRAWALSAALRRRRGIQKRSNLVSLSLDFHRIIANRGGQDGND